MIEILKTENGALKAGISGLKSEVAELTSKVQWFMEQIKLNRKQQLGASPEAVAHIMVQKFVMGVPLYRQEREFERQGILLSRQTMSNWLIKFSEDRLTPIYESLHMITI